MRDLRWGAGISLAEIEENAFYIVPAGTWDEQDRARLPEGFIGSSYSTTQRWLPTELNNLGDLARWMLFRERRHHSGGAPARQQVELWLLRER